MTRYDDRLAAADIRSLVAPIVAIVGAKADREFVDAIEAAAPGLSDRLSAVLDQVAVGTAAVDPRFVALQDIATVTSSLSAIHSLLEQFRATRDPSVLGQIDGNADILVPLADRWSKIPKASSAAVSRVVGEVRKQFETDLRPLSEAVNELRLTLAAMSGNQATLEQQTGAILDQLRTDATLRIEAVDQRLAELRETIDAQRPRIDDAIARFEQQFSTAQEQRVAEAQELRTTTRDQAQALIDGLNESASTTVNEVADQLRQAQELVGVIAVTGTASAYGDEAREQKRIADRWRVATVVLGVLAGGFALTVILTSPGKHLSEVATRVLGGLALLGVAGYAANQSARHRRREEKARRLELIMTAFTPFIQDLPADKQEDARVKIINDVFAAPELAEVDRTALTDDNITLLARVIDVVQKMGNR